MAVQRILSMRVWVALVAMLGLALAGCDPGDAEPADPVVTFENDQCTSTPPADWPEGPLEIELSNGLLSRAAVIMGTYDEGFGLEDLEAYGSDISTRPPYINALEIFEIAAGATDQFGFDHGPGLYFVVCMPEADTMTVLGDLTIES